MALPRFFCTAAFAAATLCACSGGTPNTGGPIPVFSNPPVVFNSPQNTATPSAGTQWTYDYAVSMPSPWPLPASGTLGIRYDGTMQYRGGQYGQIEAAGSISSQDAFVYFAWNTAFVEYATANTYVPPMPCDTPPRGETVLSSAVDFIHPHPPLSGTAQLYLCGTPNTVLNWSLSVTDSGPATVTVPAGTFATRKVSGVWVLGSVERDYTAYIYGTDVIQRDTTQYNSGSVAGSFTVKLRSGPINVAIPGPPELGADYW